jgi:hypothetical protein
MFQYSDESEVILRSAKSANIVLPIIFLIAALFTNNLFSANDTKENNNSNYNDFLFQLDALYDKDPIYIKEIDTTNEAFISENVFNLEEPIRTSYVFIEKNDNSCLLPTYFSQLYTNHFQDKFYQSYAEPYNREDFSGTKTSVNRKIFFTSSDSINKKFKVFKLTKRKKSGISDDDFCSKFVVKFYDYDIKNLLLKYSPVFDSYYMKISNKNINSIIDDIPNREIYADSSDYKFNKFDGHLSLNDESYKVWIKLRGNTKQHWVYKKKSYTVRPRKGELFTEKLFYIPERRAIIGEYMINKISKFIGLEALEATFGRLYINGNYNGLYYISNGFNKDFLKMNNLPESNIYHTDSHKTLTKNFSIDDISIDMFISDIKDYENNFERDINYFINILKRDKSYLANNWKKHFDQDNLISILSMQLLSGTQHYDLHNIFFYINPVNGKIYFFPWDFMNYINVGNLKNQSNLSGKVDYRNYSQFLSKLLSIREVRHLRNDFIITNGNNISEFIQDFIDQEVPYIYSAMVADDTVPLSLGEWGRPALSEFMEIPQSIIDNIDFQISKINENLTNLSFNLIADRDNKLQLLVDLQSYAGINIKCIDILYEDNEKSACVEENLNLFSDIQYKEEYGSTISINSTQHKFNIKTNRNKVIKNIYIKYSSIFDRSNIKEIVLNYKVEEKLNNLQDKPAGEEWININHPEILVKEGRFLSFKNKLVFLKEDIILPKGTELRILPGTKIFLDKGVSIISYGSITAIGEKNNKIEFLPLGESPWGSVAMIGKDSTNKFNYCTFAGGSGKYSQGKYFSAMLSGHEVNDIRISNCLFKNSVIANGGDDAVNIKKSYVLIDNSKFIGNGGDAIDFDFVDNNSRITNSQFINNGNDAIDLSSSNVYLSNIEIVSSGDKGLSVGEKSYVYSDNLRISKTKIGIANKDSSFIDLSNSYLTDNIIGIGLYNKKKDYKNSKINVLNTKIKGNYLNCGIESFNKYGHESPVILIDNPPYNSGRKYKYIINADLKKLSKRDIIRSFYDNENFNRYINLITFNECRDFN